MRLIRTTVCLVAIMAATLGAIGCALHGKSPQRQIASIGIQVISGLDATTKTAGELRASKVITDAQYETFLVKMKVVYTQASRLADALQAYNANASTDTASQVKAALDALAVLVPQLSSQIGGTAGAKIADMISQVNQLIINIAAAIAPQARAVPFFEPEVCFG